MNEYIEQALKKLETGYSNIKLPKGNDGKVINKIKEPVKKALEGFCRQDAEFAQAVVQGGDLGECLRSAADKIKEHDYAFSDIETYTAAVRFYFQTAEVSFKMCIELCPENSSTNISITKSQAKKAAPKALELSFDDLFD